MNVLIQMEKVEKAYQLGKQTVPALRGIDLQIAKGDFLAVVGPSGSGKTTLLNLLALIDEPTQGTVRFGGKSVSTLSDDELTTFRNQHVGIIFQTFNLVPVLSAVENVALALQIRGAGQAESEKAAAAELARVGLADFGHHKPDELSGGQRQRVAIARALVTKPDILIADEPTAALDGKTALEIVNLMRELNAQTQMTFVFSTHDVRLLDHVGGRLELVDGRVVKREGQVAA